MELRAERAEPVGVPGARVGVMLQGEELAVHKEPRKLSWVGALSRASGSHRRVLAGSSPNPRRFFLHSHAHTHVGGHTQPNPHGNTAETSQPP